MNLSYTGNAGDAGIGLKGGDVKFFTGCRIK